MKFVVEHADDEEVIVRYGPIEISIGTSRDRADQEGLDVGVYEHAGDEHYGAVWVPMNNIIAEEGEPLSTGS